MKSLSRRETKNLGRGRSLNELVESIKASATIKAMTVTRQLHTRTTRGEKTVSVIYRTQAMKFARMN